MKLVRLLMVLSISVFCFFTVLCNDVSQMEALKKVLHPPNSLNWTDTDPCKWSHVNCSKDNQVTHIQIGNQQLKGSLPPNLNNLASLEVLDLHSNSFTGSIPNLSGLKQLKRLILANNCLTGVIPDELTNLADLKELDIANNQIHGKVPHFRSNVFLKVDGNVDIGQDGGPRIIHTIPTVKTRASSKLLFWVIIGFAVSCISAFFVARFVICFYRAKFNRSRKVVIHPHLGSDSVDDGGTTSKTMNLGIRDMHSVEAGHMVISIQVLRSVTNNFSQDNIVGKGGFGTVYSGELHDGTKIAVKRMESGVMSEKGLDEFKSEIDVLTKVRHKNLVVLLGYCLDENERILVFEYMPQGTLSRYLFDWNEKGLKPLEWTKRLTIALDVARGVEYLHGLTQQSFIHRDLKPSNILLGDDMRAKVADFGYVRLVPDGKASLVTRLAGTFGYLAPEYAVTGRVTTKIDVFSFGVILMELITGRRAIDESQDEENVHLVPWFRRMHLSKESFQKAIDPFIDLNEDILASISPIADLAYHCCAREPHRRPDMSQVVHVLASLVELWKPSNPDPDDDISEIPLDITLPQAVKIWQAREGMDYSSSVIGSSTDHIPQRPSGFADSFATSDGR